MRLFQALLTVFSLVSLAAALANQDDNIPTTTTNTKPSPTTVWVTTTIDGKLTTAPSFYSQSFMTTYNSANQDDVKSGDIGMGSLSSVGGIRSYAQTTITNNGAPGDMSHSSLYGGLFGVLVLIAGVLV
ncbi:Pga1 GPI-anchored protein [Scheffersomyces xylosifermentans]|uniref:Pga1 GPI-anchored protein n=1 Tax=Scheffersomyces xylosifermentans TaxID=1304137 RepID=UPI00315D200E